MLNGTYEFPTYSHCCPICHGKNCCIRHGYYFRPVIDENGTFFKYFPIARYLCRRKGKAKINHRTFSLLPWQLIPYRKQVITFLLSVADYQSVHSKKETIDNFYPLITTPGQLSDIQDLLETSHEKLKFFRMINPDSNFFEFISYTKSYVSEEQIRGPTVLSWDYYIKNGNYYENSQFLFGCASQFC